MLGLIGWPLQDVDVEDWTAEQLEAIAGSSRGRDRERTRKLAAVLRHRLKEPGLSESRELGIRERLAVLERVAGDLVIKKKALPVLARAVRMDPEPPARSPALRKASARSGYTAAAAPPRTHQRRPLQTPAITPRESARQAATRDFAERLSAAYKMGSALGEDAWLGIDVPPPQPDVATAAEELLRFARRRAALNRDPAQ